MPESDPNVVLKSNEAKLEAGAMSQPKPAPPFTPVDNPEPEMNMPAGPDNAPMPAGIPGQPLKPHESIAQKVGQFVTQGQDKGTFWRGIISGALTGMVAGAGTGHIGPGVAAGAKAAQEMRQRQFENQMQQNREQSEQQLRNFQIAELNHRLLGDVWDLSNKQAVAMEEHATFENSLKKFAHDAPGGIDLGVVRDADDLVALHKAHPELPNDATRGSIFTAPHLSPVLGGDGKPTGAMKYDGVQAVYVPPDFANQLISEDIDVPIFVPGKFVPEHFVPGKKKGEAGHTEAAHSEPGHYETQHFRKGTYTNKEILTLQGSRAAEVAKTDNDAAEAKAKLALAKAQQTLQGKPGALTEEEKDTLAHQLAIDPTSLRLSDLGRLQAGDRAQILVRTLKENPKFDTKAYTRALDTIINFTSGDVSKNLAAFNGAIRHLAMLGEAADALQNNKWYDLNRMANELGVKFYDKDLVASYNAIHAAVTEEVSKVYKGASPTDPEIDTMKAAFSSAQAPKSARAAVATTMRLMGEKVQDYYRTFRNGTGRTPEEEGIQLVNPDVQATLQRYVGDTIKASGPPRPPGIPSNATLYRDEQGNPKGYSTPDMKPGTMVVISPGTKVP